MNNTNIENHELPASTYLLHIYRRGESSSTDLVGTLEKLGNGDKEIFHTINGLLQLLGMENNGGGLAKKR